MKESVKSPKNPWPPAVCAVAIVAVFFYLLFNSSPQPPTKGSNLKLDLDEIFNADRIETNFDETGSIAPGMDKAKALAVGPGGNLYIAGNNEVIVFDADDVEIARFPIEGAPNCIGVAPDGVAFIGFAGHVEVFDAKGGLISKWEPIGGTPFLTSIAVDEKDVFVADAGNRVVYRYDRNGELMGRIGESDPDRDVPGIIVPSPNLDVAFDRDGVLWVVNPGRMGLESYRPNGDLIMSWYKPSNKLEGFSGCCNPTHIAFDMEGRLITCDKGLVRLKIYEADTGEFTELIAGGEVFPREQPMKDLVVDARNRILVLDPGRNTVRIFEQKEDDHV